MSLILVVAYVLDATHQIVQVRVPCSMVRGHLANEPVDILGADINNSVRLAVALSDFVCAAPAIYTVPAVRRYGDGRPPKLAVVEMGIEKFEHGLGTSCNFREVQHGCGLPQMMWSQLVVLLNISFKSEKCPKKGC